MILACNLKDLISTLSYAMLQHLLFSIAKGFFSPQNQRCRSVFNIGGIIPHFYRFFGILKFWGGYSGFVDFSSFNDFENLGVYSGFNENVLKQLKIRIRMHKINK